jgi:hypothetical protein
MILGDVEETITVVEYDEDTYEELVKVHDSITSNAYHTLHFFLSQRVYRCTLSKVVVCSCILIHVSDKKNR